MSVRADSIRVLGILAVVLTTSVVGLRAGAGHQNPPAGQQPDAPAAVHFHAVDVWVDAGAATLGGWQVELTDLGGKVVGVEGGADQAFRDAPRYDPAVLHGDGPAERLILAALKAPDEAAPSGRIRVARIHLPTGRAALPRPTPQDPVAADADGNPLAITITATPAGEPR